MYPARPHLSLLGEYAEYSEYPRPGDHDRFDGAPADSFLPGPAEGATGVADESWRLAALCAETDPEAFFPEKGGSTREAKRVCRSCTVQAQCLEFALAGDERFGIWGGLSERERRRLRLQRRMPLSA